MAFPRNIDNEKKTRLKNGVDIIYSPLYKKKYLNIEFPLLFTAFSVDQQPVTLAQRGYVKFTFGIIVRSFSVVRVKNGISKVLSLSINKAYIKPMLTFWPF